jgi:hypothetical protein
MAASRSVDLAAGNGGAAAPTTPAKTRQVITATPNAGLRAVRVTVCRIVATEVLIARGILEAWAVRIMRC